MGDKVDNIRKALDMLDQPDGIEVISVSSFYKTEPEGYEEQDWFVNAAAHIETHLSPEELLGSLKEVENKLGRTKSIRWGPRKIDLDILLYDQLSWETPDLVIPHPHMHQRAFVLVPLAEIAPEAVHPNLCKNIESLLFELQTAKTVRRLDV
jgi:2-amino-4-hydroxy-6-hydroxymethyldihydropteridine diphosphokinase